MALLVFHTHIASEVCLTQEGESWFTVALDGWSVPSVFYLISFDSLV
jgi:hypothetical protein